MKKNKNSVFREKYNLWIFVIAAILVLALIANQTITTLAYLDTTNSSRVDVKFNKHLKGPGFAKPI